jgi:LuxR family maltose regulon positive regulatory protein
VNTAPAAREAARQAAIPSGVARDGAPPSTQLLWAAAFLLLEAVAAGPPAGTDPALAAELAGLLSEVTRSASPPPAPPWPAEPLTHSETRVLRYLPTDLSAREIADELCLSVNTVKTHLAAIYRKLPATRRREAVSRARELELI